MPLQPYYRSLSDHHGVQKFQTNINFPQVEYFENGTCRDLGV